MVSKQIEKPIISVIIPTFRRPQLLKRAIDSVLAQTYPHFQICIYDDASKDETSRMVGQYRDERISYHAHPENIGLNNNYNYGLDRIDTPFFIFLSDDDLFMPSFLEEAIKGFEQYPDAGVFVGGVIYMDKKKRLMGVISHEGSGRSYYSSRDIINETVQGRFASLINAMIFRREVRDKIGRFNEKWLDIDFVTRALLQFSVILSPVSCIIYQLHSNFSHTSNITEFWDMKIAVRDMILNSDIFDFEKKDEIERLLNHEMRIYMSDMVYQRFVTSRFGESLKGIDMLKMRYSLNKKESILKFFSELFVKIPPFVYFFKIFVNSWRVFMRVFHFRKLKKKLGEVNYQAFATLVLKI
jgi:glycosyltransferase involved in cell wall biosynthesis